jgi:hypothetical protein
MPLPEKFNQTCHNFVHARNFDHVPCYFVELPAKHWFLLVKKLVLFAIERNKADTQLVGDLLNLPTVKELCPHNCLEQAFTLISKVIDNIVLDSPKAFEHMAAIFKATDLDIDKGHISCVVAKCRQSRRLSASLL